LKYNRDAIVLRATLIPIYRPGLSHSAPENSEPHPLALRLQISTTGLEKHVGDHFQKEKSSRIMQDNHQILHFPGGR
jgi:hypothetical protein